MPIPFTDAERDAVKGAQLDCYARFEAQNPDLDWVDFSVGLDDPDWFNGVTLHDDIDANTMSMSATLLRDTAGLSLAPLIEGSSLNRNGAGDYAAMLDLVRMWRVSVCVLPHGDPEPTFPDDYHEIGKGYIDTIQVDDAPATIQVGGRGEEAIIIDSEILEVRTYSVGSGDDMETVIQAMLNDNMPDPPTLYVPVATSYLINEFEQDVGNLMAAVQRIASIGGFLLRYRYDDAGVNRLTLFLPDREAAEGDENWTIEQTEYLRLPVNKLDISGVRNYITVKYLDETTGASGTVASPISGTSDSITRYRKRPMPIELSGDTQINTEDRAQGFADAICSDLEYPKLEQAFETYAFWFVQLTDWGKMKPNGVTY